MAVEPIPLRAVRVRVVRPDEVPRFNALLREHHYLGFRKFCGRRLRHVAVLGERWLALLGWHAAALHCAAREHWIGWHSLQRRQRLFLVVNNSRFLVLPEAAGTPHLASRVLGLSLRRLPGDWLARHGHPILLAESFVDPRRFAGTCYRAANWLEIGRTRGFGRTRGARGYVAHGQPKRVFVYPLRRNARHLLAAPVPRPEWLPWRPRMKLTTAQMLSLRDYLERVPDPRRRRGKRYPWPALLTLVLAARVAGATTLTEMSDFGRALDQSVLQDLGIPRRAQTGRFHAPGISTLHYALKDVDVEQLEDLLAAWTRDQAPDDEPLALDGKVLRGSYDHDRAADGTVRDEDPWQQLSAVGILSGLIVGQRGFTGATEDAEGAILRQSLEPWKNTGRCVIADALHTTLETAQFIVDSGLFYILTVKGNQPTILEQLREDYHWQVAAHTVSGLEHGRLERRTIQVSPELDPEVPWVAFPGVRFAARLVREVVYKKTGEVRSTQVVYLLTNLPPELATPELLERWSRLYWTIENRVHYVRDTALREDACRVRKGSLPRVMAAFANLAISVLRLLGKRNLKRAMSNFKLRPNTVVAAVWSAAACAAGA